MKIYFIKKIVLLSLVFIFCSFVSVKAFSGPGAGTAEDPFLVANCVQLQEMSDDLAVHYKLVNDIDCEDTSNWNGFKGFQQIGTSTAPFTGGFDGDDFSIDGLFIDRGDENHIGLFGHINGATITDVVIENSDFVGNDYVGGLVGYAEDSSISGVIVDATVEGNDYVGGLVGYAYYSTIYQSGSSGAVTGSSYVGGFAGKAQGINSSSRTTITQSYATGDVVASVASAGGFVGLATAHSLFENTYARGDASGPDEVGGFSGALSAISIIRKSYSTGLVTSVGNKSGFQGMMAAGPEEQLVANFWDTETSGTTDYSSDQVLGVTSTVLKTTSTFTDAGWDFDAVWTRLDIDNDGYPYLAFQFFPDIISPVLTSLKDIPSKVTVNKAILQFTTNEACPSITATRIESTLGSGAEALVASPTTAGGVYTASIRGIEVGGTYSFTFSCTDASDNVSNVLSVGPFTVISSNTYGTPLLKKKDNQERFDTSKENNQTVSSVSTTTTSSTKINVNKIFNRDLYRGISGEDVKFLQTFLNNNNFVVSETGPGSSGNETTLFGTATRAALIKFQEKNNIFPAVGYFGPKTRSLVESVLLK